MSDESPTTGNIAPDDQQEDTSDFAQDPSSFRSDAVVSATDWTTQTVLSQLSKGNIELNPDFQRRDAWKIDRKSRFIESLMLGIPIPQLVLAERKNKRNSFIVIDGKQRLLALRQFCAEKTDPDYKSFSLRELNIKTKLNGKSFDDLKEDDEYLDDVTNFDNQPIRTIVIKNWPDEKFLYQVFLRLNTGSVPLSPQELRQALHPGPFSTFVDQFSAISTEIQGILNLKAPDFRMRDAELVIRYFAFRNYLSSYKGNLAPLFDTTTESLNAAWSGGDNLITKQAQDLTDAIQFTLSIFAENAFRKWNGRAYEKSLNRAVFDVMVLFFDNAELRRASADKISEIESAFKMICQSDHQFRSAIEGTTKSIDSIFTRLSHWGIALSDAVGGSHVKHPELIDGKIIL